MTNPLPTVPLIELLPKRTLENCKWRWHTTAPSGEPRSVALEIGWEAGPEAVAEHQREVFEQFWEAHRTHDCEVDVIVLGPDIAGNEVYVWVTDIRPIG